MTTFVKPAARPVRLLLAVIVCLTLSSCGVITYTRPGEYRTPFEARLAALRDSGRSAALRELTDFGWDEVHLFNSYTPREYVERVVGHDVIDGSSVPDHTSLLVFERGGRIVDTVSVYGDYVRADDPSWGSDVVVAPWGTGFVRLSDPG